MRSKPARAQRHGPIAARPPPPGDRPRAYAIHARPHPATKDRHRVAPGRRTPRDRSSPCRRSRDEVRLDAAGQDEDAGREPSRSPARSAATRGKSASSTDRGHATAPHPAWAGMPAIHAGNSPRPPKEHRGHQQVIAIEPSASQVRGRAGGRNSPASSPRGCAHRIDDADDDAPPRAATGADAADHTTPKARIRIDSPSDLHREDRAQQRPQRGEPAPMRNRGEHAIKSTPMRAPLAIAREARTHMPGASGHEQVQHHPPRAAGDDTSGTTIGEVRQERTGHESRRRIERMGCGPRPWHHSWREVMANWRDLRKVVAR